MYVYSPDIPVYRFSWILYWLLRGFGTHVFIFQQYQLPGEIAARCLHRKPFTQCQFPFHLVPITAFKAFPIKVLHMPGAARIEPRPRDFVFQRLNHSATYNIKSIFMSKVRIDCNALSHIKKTHNINECMIHNIRADKTYLDIINCLVLTILINRCTR